jgi:hypothetical protein
MGIWLLTFQIKGRTWGSNAGGRNGQHSSSVSSPEHHFWMLSQGVNDQNETIRMCVKVAFFSERRISRFALAVRVT